MNKNEVSKDLQKFVNDRMRAARNATKKIFGVSLDNKSIRALERFEKAINAEREMDEMLACFSQAKLFSKMSTEKLTEHFGIRMKFETACSVALRIVNGLMNENEKLKAELAQTQGNSTTK